MQCTPLIPPAPQARVRKLTDFILKMGTSGLPAGGASGLRSPGSKPSHHRSVRGSIDASHDGGLASLRSSRAWGVRGTAFSATSISNQCLIVCCTVLGDCQMGRGGGGNHGHVGVHVLLRAMVPCKTGRDDCLTRARCKTGRDDCLKPTPLSETLKASF